MTGRSPPARRLAHLALGGVLLCGGTLSGASPAAAQYTGAGATGMGGMGNMGGGGIGGPGGLNNPGGGARERRAAPPPPPRLQPDVWPRLDTGAVFCSSLDNLRQRSAMASDPAMAGALPQGCQTVRRMVPVRIVSRAGPGLTQVEITGPQPQTGWTDAWLPDKPGGGPGTQAASPGRPPQGGPGR